MTTRLVLLSPLVATLLFGHCDSLDGPVVQAARRALASGDVDAALAWVQPGQESAVREAFLQTMSVRKLNAGAEKLADTWFFETLVRIHRMGEGAPFTGLKPAGTGLPDAVRDADNALATRDLRALEQTLTAALQQSLRERFSHVLHARDYDAANVTAGRKYVAAYVDFIHFAEGLENSLARHGEEAGQHIH